MSNRDDALKIWLNKHNAICVSETITAGTKRKPLEITTKYRFAKNRIAIVIQRTDGKDWWIYTDLDTNLTNETLKDAESRLGI